MIIIEAYFNISNTFFFTLLCVSSRIEIFTKNVCILFLSIRLLNCRPLVWGSVCEGKHSAACVYCEGEFSGSVPVSAADEDSCLEYVTSVKPEKCG